MAVPDRHQGAATVPEYQHTWLVRLELDRLRLALALAETRRAVSGTCTNGSVEAVPPECQASDAAADRVCALQAVLVSSMYDGVPRLSSPAVCNHYIQ